MKTLIKALLTVSIVSTMISFALPTSVATASVKDFRHNLMFGHSRSNVDRKQSTEDSASHAKVAPIKELPELRQTCHSLDNREVRQ